MLKFCLLIFCMGFCGSLFSQCKNSIAIKKLSKEAGVEKKGVIEIEVGSTGEYVCFLSIEKGSGPEQIQKKEGHGNSVVHFEGLDVSETYKVQVVFQSESNPHCKKLEKSQIIIDGE